MTLPSTLSLISYDEYTAIVNKLATEGKTSGPMQTESLVTYTYLNHKRMQRLDKTSVPSRELQEVANKIPFEMTWVVITEAWCGDSAQNLPFIAKLAGLCPNVILGLVFRDDNLDFMDNYLTNGSRSIPKLIVFRTNDMTPVAQWGPRPAEVLEIIRRNEKQEKGKISSDELAGQIHLWYAKNKNSALQKELLQLFQRLNGEYP